MTSIYLIGSLRNPEIPQIATKLRAEGYDVFDDWHAPGPQADDFWREYEKARGHSYKEALRGHAGRHIFEFDHEHLLRCDIGVMVMPAGKSGHSELGYLAGLGKPTFVLFDEEPERYDVMYQLFTAVCFSLDELKVELAKVEPKRLRLLREHVEEFDDGALVDV